MAIGDPTEVEGASGLQNAYPHVLRQVRPTRVFLPTITDLHPDHRIVNEEMLISLFHAQGSIWPELGPPVAVVPAVYEYATYCDFPEAPQLRATDVNTAFIQAIIQKDQSLVLSDYEDGLKSAALSIAANESALKGRPVHPWRG